MALASRLGLVTFDATNTLMQLSRPVGTQYRELLAARLKLGSDAAAAASDGGGSSSDLLSSPVSEEGIEASFLRAYKERAAELSCFGAGVCSAQEWWRPLVRNTFVGAGVDEGALCDEGALFQPLFEDLWRHFAGPKAWELLPGAQELLIALDGHRHAGGLRVGVVSDWDNRLPELLASIGVAQHCDFINAAFNIGHAKPARAAFDAAREAAGGVSLLSGALGAREPRSLAPRARQRLPAIWPSRALASRECARLPRQVVQPCVLGTTGQR